MQRSADRINKSIFSSHGNIKKHIKGLHFPVLLHFLASRKILAQSESDTSQKRWDKGNKKLGK